MAAHIPGLIGPAIQERTQIVCLIESSTASVFATFPKGAGGETGLGELFVMELTRRERDQDVDGLEKITWG